MKDSIVFTNIGILFFFWALSIFLLYLIIKAAVRNGVREAFPDLTESLRAIERHVEEIKKVDK